MIFLKRFVSIFGVTLCVAPIFLLLPLSAIAQQQGNYQADLLYELQAMRQEIAELRDMVERQDYQLRQMQRGNQQVPQSNDSVNTPNYQTPATNNDTTVNTSPEFNTDPSLGSQSGAPSQNDAPNQSGYPPYTGPSDQSYQQGQQQPSTVEERVIGQQSTSGYPPVEERTIGNGQPAQAPIYDPETYNQVPIDSNQASVNNGEPIVDSQSGLPTPYERTVPSRQPIPNNIPDPNVNPNPGGVIAIPSGEPQVVPQTPSGQAQQNTAVLNEQSIYQQGFELLKQSKHDDAVAMFKQQISQYPSGEYSDDAHYWIAESLYVNRDLDQSKLYFRAIVDNFAQSSRVPDAMLKTAYIEQEQGNKIEARILLQEIIQYHPRSNAAISAKNRLADL